MLDEKELIQVREYVIKNLPELLRADPAVATTIEGILAQQFPRRDEFARLLDELEQSRQENRVRFNEVDIHLEQINKRFEQVDKRFEQVDKRFEQVDKRFEQVDKRFEGIETRLDRVEHNQLGMRRDIAKLQSGQESIIKRMDGMQAWIQFIVGNLRNEKGQSLEEIAAAALSYGLQNPDIKPENIRLRQKLVDRDKLVYTVSFETEVDIIAQNGSLIAFEVKSTGRSDEVAIFSLKVRLLSLQNPGKLVKGIFVAPLPTPEIREQCEQYGIELLDAPRGS